MELLSTYPSHLEFVKHVDLVMHHSKIFCRTPVRAIHPFQRVYFDLIQLLEALNGDCSLLHFLDDSIKFQFVCTLREKSQAVDAIEDFTEFVFNQYGYKIQIFYTDGERSLENHFSG